MIYDSIEMHEPEWLEEVICEICGNGIDVSKKGWQETDTGDICKSCVENADALQDPFNYDA